MLVYLAFVIDKFPRVWGYRKFSGFISHFITDKFVLYVDSGVTSFHISTGIRVYAMIETALDTH